MATGLCGACQADDKAQANKEQQRIAAEAERRSKVERDKLTTNSVEEPFTEPLDGLHLIGISIVGGIFGGLLIASEDAAIFGFIIIAVTGMLYLAGVIRWAVSGSQFLQLNRLHRQNNEIIELLELIANKDRNGADLDLLRRLRESGQIEEKEYRKQRRNLLRD